MDPSEDTRAQALIDRARALAPLDPKAAAAVLDELAAIAPDKVKGVRASLLQTSLLQAAAIADALGWRGSAILRGGRLLVEQDGVLLDASEDARFFRKAGKGIARPMRQVLEARGVAIRTVFDVGANLGEVALAFARRYPDARVFAFEAAPENVERLRANLALQPKPLPNLVIVPEAVADRTGEVEITEGADSMNTILVDDAARLEERASVRITRVACGSLEDYCRRFDVAEIDFLKVDIEGAEPLLAPSVRALAGRIRTAVVEVSRYNTIEAYAGLCDAFAAGGLRCFSERLEPVDDPASFIRAQLADTPAANLWFLEG